MKKLTVILILLFTVSLFAQDKKLEIQNDFTQLQKQANELKAQVYDAQEFITKAKVQIEDLTKKMLELQQKYQAIVDNEKKEAELKAKNEIKK